MYAKVANDFSPDVIHMYNASASPIAAGCGVMRLPSVAQAVPDAANMNSPVTYVKGVVHCTASFNEHQFNFIGVAVETIAPSTWGPVCIGGPCKVRIGTSASYSACCMLGIDSASAGSFIEIAVASTEEQFFCSGYKSFCYRCRYH